MSHFCSLALKILNVLSSGSYFFISKDEEKSDSLCYNYFKEIPFVICLSHRIFLRYISEPNSVSLGALQLAACGPNQPPVIFIAPWLILMKLLCDQRRVQCSVVVFGAELEVKSMVQTGASFLIASITGNVTYWVKRHWCWK